MLVLVAFQHSDKSKGTHTLYLFQNQILYGEDNESPCSEFCYQIPYSKCSYYHSLFIWFWCIIIRKFKNIWFAFPLNQIMFSFNKGIFKFKVNSHYYRCSYCPSYAIYLMQITYIKAAYKREVLKISLVCISNL